MSYVGGYYLIKEPLVRGGINKHTAADEDALSQRTLDAVNVVQSTPWRINRRVFDVMAEIQRSGSALGGLPTTEAKPIPTRYEDDVWEAMSEQDKAQHKYLLRMAHDFNARELAKGFSLVRKLKIAEMMQDHPQIYFPHFVDFRTRMYPMCQDLQPQSDHLGKSLIMFAEGRPLGDTGLDWLKIRLASAAGHDKWTFEDQIAWVDEHMTDVLQTAEDPFGYPWWYEVAAEEEPWNVLATAFEIWDALIGTPDAREFVSHLPVPMDGSINGCQHLSLLGRDPIGALATNCTSCPDRQDLYSAVAEAVAQIISQEAAGGSADAHEWVGNVGRKTVKRAVMTTPYGVTARGIRDQLIADHHVTGENKLRAATYLQMKISEALEQQLSGGRAIMAYLQDTAAALADAGLPLVWVTPAGSRVTQSYWNVVLKRVDTLIGRINLVYEEPDSGLDKRRAAMGSAPNVIHSLDAAMAQEVSCRLAAEGITDLHMVHDSYGTHASNTDRLLEVTRQVAYDQYSGDWLSEFHAYVGSYSQGVVRPEPPPRGTFDVSEVLKARYFFS